MVAIGDKLVFIHIPRTAGTYVTGLLEKAGYAKSVDGDAHRIPTTEEIGDRQVVTILREPIDWLNSYLRFTYYGGRKCLPVVDEFIAYYIRTIANWTGPVTPTLAKELSQRNLIDGALKPFLSVPNTLVVDHDQLSFFRWTGKSESSEPLLVRQLKTSNPSLFSQEIRDEFRRSNPIVFDLYDQVKEDGYKEINKG